MPAFDYDCPTITNGFIAESGRYINEVASKAIPYVPWLANTPRGEWRDGMGKIHNSIVFERTVPQDTDSDWVDEVFSDGASDAGCDYTAETVDFGQTTRSFRKQSRYIQTNDFCIEDLSDDFLISKFLEGVARNLRGVSQYVWASRRRREYSRLAEHKLTANASFNLANTTWSAASPPTSQLLNGHLNMIYSYLHLNGAMMDGALGMTGNSRPIVTLITSAETSQSLIRQDPLLREDFRFAFMGMGAKHPLITAYGEGISYNGFKHVIDYPRRWDIVGGVYVERFPYGDPEATTKGYKQELAANYTYAEYEDSVVHIPSVYRELVPRPKGNMGNGFKFDPQTYMGEFGFSVIKDRQCNPLGNKGFFHALFKSASEPGQTWHGFVIRHKTCPANITPVSMCYEYEAAT